MTPLDLFKLSQTFTMLTGFPCPVSYYTQSSWVDWLGCLPEDPCVETDLDLVVRYVKRNLRPHGPYLPNSLRFSNLIANCQNFLELRSLARAEKRGRDPQPARTSILRATGRVPYLDSQERKEDRTISAGQAMERTKLAGMLAEWKAKL